MRRNRLAIPVTVFCVALAVVAGTFPSHRMGALQGILFDSAVLLRSVLFETRPGDTNSSTPVAVVGVDVRSLAAPELRSLPRALMGPVWAQLLEALFAAQAKVVAFDFLLAFSGNAVQRDYDKTFLQSLAAHRNFVVLGRSSSTLPARPYLGALGFDPGGLGMTELVPDADGVVRRVRGYWRDQTNNERLPSLAMAALLRAGIETNIERILLAPTKHLEQIPSYALIDVLRCAQTHPDELERSFGGRLVFVGTTLVDEDRKLTSARFLEPGPGNYKTDSPCSLNRLGASGTRAKSVPGVHVFAAATEAVVADRLIRPVAAAVVPLLSGAAALVGCILGFSAAPWLALASILLLSLLSWGLEAGLLVLNLWLPSGYTIAVLVGSGLLAYLIRFGSEERRRRRIQHAFGRYLSPTLVQRLAESDDNLKLTGETREVTIMFADLSGFTAMSERVSAQTLARVTNEYLQIITEQVEAHGGYVDKFIGDSVMAMWGAPLDDPAHARQAVVAALTVLDVVKKKKALAQAQDLPGFSITIGIHSGPAVVGNVGSEHRFNYTAVGETVNIASRLEGLCNIYGCPILIGEGTASAVGDAVHVFGVDYVIVKGKTNRLAVFAPVPGREATSQHKQRFCELYAIAFTHYLSREFATAAQRWKELSESSADPAVRGPAQTMAERAMVYQNSPPPADWDGAWNAKTK